MKKISLLFTTTLLLILFSFSVSAETEGYYTYEVKNGEAIITDISTLISGDVTIPSSLGGFPVTTIGDYAFEYCKKITSVTFPNSVRLISNYAFVGCSNLANIIVMESNQYYSNDEFGVLFNKQKTELIRYPIGNKKTDYTIPNSVTTVADWAFYFCDTLTSITVGNNVTSIGKSPFLECKSLVHITVDENNPNYSTDEFGVLFNKQKTKLIQYPIGNKRNEYTIPNSVTTLGEHAFRCCDNLMNVNISNNITSIGYMVFYACKGLTSIIIPDGVTTIGNCAFEYCYNLTSVTIPNSVKTIAALAFGSCKSLTCVIIPDSVTNIGNSAFSGCENLTSVTISNCVTTIGDWAFNNCNSLTDVYYEGDKEQWNKISIGKANEKLINTRLHYSSNHLNHYSATLSLPTCTERGYTTYTCACGYSYNDDYTDKLGHNHTVEVTKEATHLTEGIMTYTCACGDTYTETIAKTTEHTYNAVVTTPATHLADGVKTFTCDCGDTYTEVIAKTAEHNYTAVVTAPTCTTKGFTTYTCECGDTYVADYVDATGHNYVNSECAGCGDIKEVVADKSENTDCSCSCHSNNPFTKVIYKFIIVLCKLLRLNHRQICGCGIAHW